MDKDFSGRLLLHVGFHKTATTWMQKSFFTPEHGFQPLCTHQEIFDSICRPSDADFDISYVREFLNGRAAKVDSSRVPVVSSETLCGNPFFGGREKEIYARRLKEIAPEARILISIRDQMTMLPSIYMQYLLRGGRMSPAQFFSGKPEPGYFSFDPVHFCYDRLVALYMELFGRENVLVISQESLREDLTRVAQKIASFSGNTAFVALAPDAFKVRSPSYPEYAAPVLRRINHVQRSLLNPVPVVSLGETPFALYKIFGWAARRKIPGYLFGNYRPVSRYVAATFSGYYDDSNDRLMRIHDGLDEVGRYG